MSDEDKNDAEDEQEIARLSKMIATKAILNIIDQRGGSAQKRQREDELIITFDHKSLSLPSIKIDLDNSQDVWAKANRCPAEERRVRRYSFPNLSDKNRLNVPVKNRDGYVDAAKKIKPTLVHPALNKTTPHVPIGVPEIMKHRDRHRIKSIRRETRRKLRKLAKDVAQAWN